MVILHANILERDGRKAFAVIPYEEFVRVEEELHDYEDLKVLRAAKVREAKAATTPLAHVRKALKI